MSPLRILFALLIVSLVVFGGHYYIWTRLVRDAGLPEPWRTYGTWILAALAMIIPLSLLAMRGLPRAVSQPVAWIAFIWLGLYFFLLVLSFGGDIVTLAFRLASRGAPVVPERRLFLQRVVAAAIGGGTLLLGGAAMASALGKVQIKRVAIRLPRLSPKLSGYTIVQLSDIHVGPTIGIEFIEELVRQVNALKPDLVAITGDLVDGSVASLGELVRPLQNIVAKDGVFFVTGNHEYYSGVDEWVTFLGTLGVRVLRNERVSVRGDSGFDIAGIDDWTAKGFGNGHGADLTRALAGKDERRPVILLAHQPKAAPEAAEKSVDLQLSGHTHGGQLFPFNYLVKIDQPFVSGLYTLKNTQIYVSNGTGYWGPPMRLGAPAEITRIELSS